MTKPEPLGWSDAAVAGREATDGDLEELETPLERYGTIDSTDDIGDPVSSPFRYGVQELAVRGR